MNRNVTAVYRRYSVADLVRRELEALGIARGDIHIVPDSENVVRATSDDYRWTDALHDLDLPEEDVRTYQHCVRRGDHVVSANVDEEQVARVQEIMRRPESEAYNLDLRADEFRKEPVIAHSDTRRTSDGRVIRRRDTAYTDPYVRSYRR
jgi:hypothetical protein